MENLEKLEKLESRVADLEMLTHQLADQVKGYDQNDRWQKIRIDRIARRLIQVIRRLNGEF